MQLLRGSGFCRVKIITFRQHTFPKHTWWVGGVVWWVVGVGVGVGVGVVVGMGVGVGVGVDMGVGVWVCV